MDAKPYTVLTVRMPNDLQTVLETISAEKGESISTIVRDMVRQVAADVRRGDSLAGVSPPSSRDFR
jgi:hypothetical protein